MKRVQVKGAELEYEEMGAGEPVVCIHGALVADTFLPLVREPALRDRYRFVLYHRRGYAGSSRVTRRTTIPEQAADCLSLLDQLGIARAHLIGHSFGGAVALQVAMAAPRIVHSLALLEPGLILGESGPAYRESLIQASERFRQANPAEAVHAFLEARWQGYRPQLDRVLPGAFAQAVTDAATSFEYEIAGLPDWHFGEAEARAITAPALSVIGERSPAHSPRFAEVHALLLAWLPNAEGFVLPDATHFLQVQNPAGMAEALADFWARHPIAS